MPSNNLRTSSFLNHPPGPSSHTLGVCPALFDLSSPLCIYLLPPSFTYPSRYLLGRIVAVVMSDCSNSQGKKGELISLPPVLRDVSPHEKCRTMPATLSARLFYFRALPQLLCFPFPIRQFGNTKAGGYRKFQIFIIPMSGTNVVVWHIMKYYLVFRIWQGNKDARLPRWLSGKESPY